MDRQLKRPNLYDYSNFREYLHDWFKFENSNGRILSGAEICRRLGLPKTRSYFKDVLNGKTVSSPKVKLFVSLLELDKNQARYFSTLVDYNQCLCDPEEKEWLLEQLISLNRTPKKIINQEELAYYTNWYHGIIRTLLDIIDFKGDYASLAKMLSPPITSRQARDSIRLLQKLNLIRKNRSGFLKPTHKVISSGSFAREDVIRQYQLKQLDIARAAVSASSEQSQRVITKIVGISQSAYDSIQKKLEKFNAEITTIVHKDQEPADRVYQLGMLLVPQSRLCKNMKEKS